MRAKTLKILADFRRDLINRKCSEKPVKSRLFRNFKGVKNALRGLLLRERPLVRIQLSAPNELIRSFSCELIHFF
jgi:hypothetical protein